MLIVAENIISFVCLFFSKTPHLKHQWRALLAEWLNLLTSDDHTPNTAHMTWIPDTHILYDRKG